MHQVQRCRDSTPDQQSGGLGFKSQLFLGFLSCFPPFFFPNDIYKRSEKDIPEFSYPPSRPQITFLSALSFGPTGEVINLSLIAGAFNTIPDGAECILESGDDRRGGAEAVKYFEKNRKKLYSFSLVVFVSWFRSCGSSVAESCSTAFY